MAERPGAGGVACPPGLKPVMDLLVTLAAWGYFTLGYLLFFGPLHLGALLLAPDRDGAFQYINHLFYKGFFRLVRAVTPGLSISVGDAVREIRGAVIVSNHISYLDPILIISLYPRQKTIVKPVFFKVPIFRAVIRRSGYIAPVPEDGSDLSMLAQIQRLSGYLAGGGNLFVFPEGTRSRDGRIAPFSKGAFKIAKRCGAPVAVLRIRQTDRLFQPGRFRFQTCRRTAIQVELAGWISAPAEMPLSAVMAQARDLMV